DATVNADIPELTDEDSDGDGNLDPMDKDGDGRIRPFEFNDCLFHISGNLSGGLDLEFKEGIDPLSLTQTIHLAEGTIASFDIGCTNPFEPADDVHLATLDAATGQLVLNIGMLATARNYHVGEINEDYTITHSDPAPGDPATGEAVNVTAFGYT